jgi:penicillin-binding protein 1A
MTRKKRIFRRVLLLCTSLALLGMLSLGIMYAFVAPSLPSVQVLQEVQLQVPLRVYTRGGEAMAVFGEQRRIPASREDIPERLRQAFLAAEDDRFYEHPGVDWQGIARAVWYLARTGEKGPGGSTITMQLASNFFLTRDQTYLYKLRQIFLALKIERSFNKDRIFELYLNKIYLGHRAYGVAAAAQVYYGKSLHDLTLAETAMIASLPKAPSVVNPISNPQRALERRNYVLARMRSLDFITPEEYRRALDVPDHAKRHGTVTEVEAPFVAEMVRQAALERYGQEAYSRGYQIYTTIDGDMQAAANEALKNALFDYDRRHGYRGPEAQVELEPDPDAGAIAEALDNFQPVAGLTPGLVVEVSENSATLVLQDARTVLLGLEAVAWARPRLGEDAVGSAPESVDDVLARGDIVRVSEDEELGWRLSQIPDAQGALVAMDPFDGALRALTGGFDYRLSKFNRALQARRQPGSAFKPFIYSAALDKGFTAASLVNDAPVVLDDPSLERTWRPENFSRQFYGPTRLREAMVNSRNLVSIRVLHAMGVEAAIDYLSRFGFDPARLPRGLSLALGSGEQSPLEMARGYAVFANGGFRVEPWFIERIVGPEGQPVFEAAPAIACRECDVPVEADAGTGNPLGPETQAPPLDEVEAEAPEMGARIPEALMPPEEPDDGAKMAPAFTVAPRVIDPGNAYIIDSIMEDVIRRGTGRQAMELGRNDLSGKTGTTNDQLDAWFAGYHHSLVATAWVGYDQPRSLGRAEVGGRAALPMWIDFMDTALEQLPPYDPPMPPGMITARIDPATGKRARAGDPDAILELFREGHVPPPLEHSAEEDDEQDSPYDIY